jgi:hypothetical protein
MSKSPKPEIPKPLITFYRMLPGAREPMRADQAAGGTFPTRAFRYCEPMRTASAFGWYLFPPMDFQILWDGRETFWSHEEAEGQWLPLHQTHYPGFDEYFDARVPEDCKGFALPFLGAPNEPGLLQIWSGYVARTAPGWSVLSRPLANFPRPSGYEAYEGIIETDRWFGPIFTNVRLTRTGVPIHIRAEVPLLMLQPFPRWLYADQVLENFGLVEKLEDFKDEDWDRFRATIVNPMNDENRPRGEYAVKARRRRAQEES